MFHSTPFTQTRHHATYTLAHKFFLTMCQIYFCSILERVMQDRIGPAVGSTISFSDDMCPIIRSSTQPQIIPSPPMSHHK